MANPSTPENVERARAQVEANLINNSEEAQAARRSEELFRLKRNQVLVTGFRHHRMQLENVMKDLQESTGLTPDLERYTEELFSLTQLHDVYSRAKTAIEESRIEEYIESVRRQLHHANISVRGSNSLIGTLMRVHYVNARAKFLNDCTKEQVGQLTSLDHD